jgi:hypothetical protein
VAIVVDVVDVFSLPEFVAGIHKRRRMKTAEAGKHPPHPPHFRKGLVFNDLVVVDMAGAQILHLLKGPRMNVILRKQEFDFRPWKPAMGRVFGDLFAFDCETTRIDDHRPWIVPA